MTIGHYAQVLRRGWAFVAAGLVLGIGAALAANALLPRSYTSELTIYISGHADGDYSVAAAEVAQSRVPSFRKLMTEDRVLEDVVAGLDLVESPRELADKIVVSNEPETLLLTVAVSDASPQRAATIANGLADSFIRIMTELDGPVTAAGQEPVITIQVLERAEPDPVPAEPRPQLNLALGTLVGLLLGSGAAFVRNMLGRKIRSTANLQEVLGVPNLATFATDPTVRTEPLLDPADQGTPRWDEFRQLATNLAFVDLANARKAVVVTSARPGTGATTTVCNLAIALAAEGRDVALVDADLRRSGVAELMAVDARVGLTTVLIGQVPLDEATRPWRAGFGLDILATGVLPPNPVELMGSRQMSAVVDELRRRYDVVLFNSPPLLASEDAAVLTAAVDGALLVCRARGTRTRDAASAARILDSAAARLLGTVTTFTSRRHRRTPDRTGSSEAAFADPDRRAVDGRVEIVGAGAADPAHPTGSGAGPAGPPSPDADAPLVGAHRMLGRAPRPRPLPHSSDASR